MKIIVPPDIIRLSETGPSLFLAGSIEMGSAGNWQNKMINALNDYEGVIFNPRRNDWNSDWKQEKTNFQFRQQVDWELAAQEFVDFIVMYFDPNTKSPISLLELGLFHEKPMLVCCPKGFWRKGNVDIVCERYEIPICDDLNDLIKTTRNIVENWKD